MIDEEGKNQLQMAREEIKILKCRLKVCEKRFKLVWNLLWDFGDKIAEMKDSVIEVWGEE